MKPKTVLDAMMYAGVVIAGAGTVIFIVAVFMGLIWWSWWAATGELPPVAHPGEFVFSLLVLGVFLFLLGGAVIIVVDDMTGRREP